MSHERVTLMLQTCLAASSAVAEAVHGRAGCRRAHQARLGAAGGLEGRDRPARRAHQQQRAGGQHVVRLGNQRRLRPAAVVNQP